MTDKTSKKHPPLIEYWLYFSLLIVTVFPKTLFNRLIGMISGSAREDISVLRETIDETHRATAMIFAA